MQRASATPKLPGLTVLSGATPPDGFERHGPVSLNATGEFITRHDTPRHIVWVDGLLFAEGERGDEARVLSERYSAAGRTALHEADGYYNVVVFERQTGALVLAQDALATRPWYIYRRGGVVAVAPSPMVYRALGFPMTLSRQVLYETLRLLHPAGEESLVNEVRRMRPGVSYRLERDQSLHEQTVSDFSYRPDHAVGLDEMAREIKDIVAEAIDGVLRHPVCRARPVELSLTGGLDSRHILGELLAQERKPRQIRHVCIKRAECAAVARICAGEQLSLRVFELHELPWATLIRRWLARSGGLVNLHQVYLLAMMHEVGARGVVGFDGYLMDWLLGLVSKDNPDSITDPVRTVWGRRYTSDLMLGQLMPDSRELAARGRAKLADEAGRYQGPAWFRALMLDIQHRGVNYTGAAMALMAPEAHYFAPGATRRALHFCRGRDIAIGGIKRARLEAMRRYFPRLAEYPDPSGRAYTEYTTLHKTTTGMGRYLTPWWRFITSGGRTDPAPESEHEWLRAIPPLRHLVAGLVEHSGLVADGLISRRGLARCWRLHQIGGYEAWTLFSLLSAEAAYRCLVRREPQEQVIHDWFPGVTQSDAAE